MIHRQVLKLKMLSLADSSFTFAFSLAPVKVVICLISCAIRWASKLARCSLTTSLCCWVISSFTVSSWRSCSNFWFWNSTALWSSCRIVILLSRASSLSDTIFRTDQHFYNWCTGSWVCIVLVWTWDRLTFWAWTRPYEMSESEMNWQLET